ncbi:MAG: hypothetical protein KC561_00895, partial [Myxococcales bacterium]|nr:hypothetical protein [Myxococcales bacterium]
MAGKNPRPSFVSTWSKPSHIISVTASLVLAFGLVGCGDDPVETPPPPCSENVRCPAGQICVAYQCVADDTTSTDITEGDADITESDVTDVVDTEVVSDVSDSTEDEPEVGEDVTTTSDVVADIVPDSAGDIMDEPEPPPVAPQAPLTLTGIPSLPTGMTLSWTICTDSQNCSTSSSVPDGFRIYIDGSNTPARTVQAGRRSQALTNLAPQLSDGEEVATEYCIEAYVESDEGDLTSPQTCSDLVLPAPDALVALPYHGIVLGTAGGQKEDLTITLRYDDYPSEGKITYLRVAERGGLTSTINLTYTSSPLSLVSTTAGARVTPLSPGSGQLKVEWAFGATLAERV